MNSFRVARRRSEDHRFRSRRLRHAALLRRRRRRRRRTRSSAAHPLGFAGGSDEEQWPGVARVLQLLARPRCRPAWHQETGIPADTQPPTTLKTEQGYYEATPGSEVFDRADDADTSRTRTPAGCAFGNYVPESARSSTRNSSACSPVHVDAQGALDAVVERGNRADPRLRRRPTADRRPDIRPVPQPCGAGLSSRGARLQGKSTIFGNKGLPYLLLAPQLIITRASSFSGPPPRPSTCPSLRRGRPSAWRPPPSSAAQLYNACSTMPNTSLQSRSRSSSRSATVALALGLSLLPGAGRAD